MLNHDVHPRYKNPNTILSTLFTIMWDVSRQRISILFPSIVEETRMASLMLQPHSINLIISILKLPITAFVTFAVFLSGLLQGLDSFFDDVDECRLF
jgi:hypothetical protein